MESVSLAALWLPIIISAVAIFFVSFLIWMVLQFHKDDIKTLPDEEKFNEFINAQNIPAGVYFYPGCNDTAEMKTPEFCARYDKGPWGNINIQATKPNFGKNLTLTFIFYLVVSLLVAYITKEARQAGAEFLPVFQVSATAAILAYCAGSIPGSIFFGKPTRFIITEFVDALTYALITGLTFALLWPAPTTPAIIP